MAADVLMIHEVWFYSHMYDGQLETVRPEQTKCLKSILTFHMDWFLRINNFYPAREPKQTLKKHFGLINVRKMTYKLWNFNHLSMAMLKIY